MDPFDQIGRENSAVSSAHQSMITASAPTEQAHGGAPAAGLEPLCQGDDRLGQLEKKMYSRSKVSGHWEVQEPTTICVENLVYAVPARQLCPGSSLQCFSSKQSRVLLNGVSLIARPSEVLVIVGPSGSGKTTLLNAIALRSPENCMMDGQITYNGQSQTRRGVRSLLNYVMARDVLLCYLTVYETLVSAAELKLPHLSKAERLQRVEAVIASMELEHCRNTYVGGEWKKGLSTGEVKRVSIGVELLDNPSVLVLDEPTSGLDSALSIKIMSCLLREARKGSTIIVTLHQPCSQVFDMCDRFLLLSAGQVAYHGSAAHAHSYFSRIGHVPVKGWNPSDFYLALVSPLSSAADDVVAATDASREEILDQWATSTEKRQLDQEIELIQTQPMRVDSAGSSAEAKKNAGCFFNQMLALWKRTTLNTLRNPLSCLIILLIQAMQGLLLGGIFHNLTTVRPTALEAPPLISNSYWDNSPWMQAFSRVSTAHPFDAGLTPLLNLYQHGVDDKGSYVFFTNKTDAKAIKERIHFALDNATTCLYQTFHLKDRGYPVLPGMEQQPAANWDSWTAERMYANVLALYQIIEHRLGRGERHDTFSLSQLFDCSKFDDLNCLLNKTQLYLGDTVTCMGLPPFPPGALSIDRKPKVPINPLPPSASVVALRESCAQKVDDARLARTSARGTERMVWDFLGPEIQTLIDGWHSWTCRATGCQEPLCKKLQMAYDWMIDWTRDVKDSITGSLNLAGCLFFVSAVLGFASYEALLTFPQERPLFNRETANGLYSSLTYYIAKNIADLPFQLLPSLIMATIFYFLTGFDVTAYQFSIYFALCALTCFSAYGFGYMVSSAAPRMEVAVLVAPLTLAIWLVLAGFFLRDADIPSWIAWFKYLSFYRWAYFSFVTNQFPSGRYFGSLPNSLIRTATGITNTHLIQTSSYLLLLGFGYRVFGFFFLAFTNRRVGLES